MRQLALRILIVSVAISAILGIYALLSGEFGSFERKILFTSLSISGMSILSLACGVAWERRRLGAVPSAGALVSVGACALLLVGIWTEPRADEFWKTVGTASLVAAACAHASLMSLAVLARRFRWALLSAYLLAALLAASLVALMWTEYDDEIAWRWIGVLSVLLSATTITVPVFHRMSRLADARAPSFCPACAAPLAANGASGHCGECGARFRVEFS